jgi:hypothetical protein
LRLVSQENAGKRATDIFDDLDKLTRKRRGTGGNPSGNAVETRGAPATS